MRTLYTIGHSSHPPEHLRSLLQQHAVEVLVDTRSSPYSRFAPYHNREALRASVTAVGLRYLYLGDVVGGRPHDELHHDGKGRVLYGRVAEDPAFLRAIARLERGADQFRIALLCAEEDPARCHRRLLIGRVLVGRGAHLLHIRGDGTVDDEAAIYKESGKPLASSQPTLFGDMEEEQWKSSASVSRRGPRKTPSAH